MEKIYFRRNLSLTLATLLVASFTASAAIAAVKISTDPTENMTCSQGVCTPTRKKAILNVTDLADMLASGDVTVKSDSKAWDIEVDAALTWTSTHGLTLDSSRSIIFNRPVTVAGTGALTINTVQGTGGDYRFFGKGHVEFWDTNSLLTINGKWYELVDGLKELRKRIRQNPAALVALRKSHNEHGHEYIGPPIGIFEGIFEGLGNEIANVTIEDNGSPRVGLFDGLTAVGTPGIIRDFHVTGLSITENAPAYVGGLVGANNLGTIANCSVSGQITLTASGSYAGGIMGIGTTVINSSAAVTIVGSNSAAGVGGIAGRKNAPPRSNPGIIDQSYASVSIAGGDGTAVGGIIGENHGTTISNSYAAVAVSGGSNALVGGLAGINADDSDSGQNPVILNAYSTGAVSAGDGSSVGGFIGWDAADSTNSNTYWDLDTSGVSDPEQGAGNIKNDPGITGLTDAQLKSGLPAGFDPKIWGIDPKINNGYPYLLNNPPR